MKKQQSKLEHLFENSIWNYRFIVIIAVIALLIGSLIAFYFGTFHTIKAVQNTFIQPIHDSTYILIDLISSLDNFLIGLVLLIIAYGIYELFISNIDAMEEQDIKYPNWLKFHSLDELKSVLSKIIINILIVYFFKSVVIMKFETNLSILYLALGILLISIANYLSHRHKISLLDEKYSQKNQ